MASGDRRRLRLTLRELRHRLVCRASFARTVRPSRQ
jgi:hypothetical protein